MFTIEDSVIRGVDNDRVVSKAPLVQSFTDGTNRHVVSTDQPVVTLRRGLGQFWRGKPDPPSAPAF